jgi:TPR repeat protein
LINLKLFCFLECWDGEPHNRPTIYQVVDWLKAIITKADVIIEDPQFSSSNKKFNNKLESREELFQLIQNFDKINIKEINPIEVSNEREKFSFEKGFDIIVDEINDLIFKSLNRGIEDKLVNEQVTEYLNNRNISTKEIYHWLSNNQNNSNSLFLLGYFNYFGIGIIENNDKAFNLFIKASEKDHLLAQSYVGDCYLQGYGTFQSEELAFKYLEKVAKQEFTFGQVFIGYLYENGVGINKDLKKTLYWYEKAVNNGNIMAMFNLGTCYYNGIGVEKDYNKAFKLFKQSAEEGYPKGIMRLGYCYSNGIGTEIDKQKAFESYQISANLGIAAAQYSLALMYEIGDGITEDIEKAIYWYEKSAKQGYLKAQNKLDILQKTNDI